MTDKDELFTLMLEEHQIRKRRRVRNALLRQRAVKIATYMGYILVAYTLYRAMQPA